MKSEKARGSKVTGALGLIGCVVCLVSMTLAAVGVIGTAAAGSMSGMSMSMSRMGSSSKPAASGFLNMLLKFGPEILIVSIVLVTLSLLLRRNLFALLSVVVGAVVYWSMYMQASTMVMVIVTLLGFVAWGLLYAKTMPKRHREVDASSKA